MAKSRCCALAVFWLCACAQQGPSASEAVGKLEQQLRAPEERAVTALPSPRAVSAVSAACPAGVPERYCAFAQAFESARAEKGIPGAAVAVIEHGELAWAHGFGVTRESGDAKVDEHTLFRIGSLTKALTATGLLSAMAQYNWDIDGPVSWTLRDVELQQPEYGTLTLRHVLSHQSGLYDYLLIQGSVDDDGLSRFLTGPRASQDVYFMVPPGTFFNYANPNYYLVGYALEKLDGVYYRDAVKRRVLDPLGLTRTFFLAKDVSAAGNYASGAASDPAYPAPVEPDTYENSWARPAGYAYSSVVDYASFLRFLLNGNPSVLSDARRHEMLSQQARDDATGGYGYGVVVASGFQLGPEYYPTTLYTHTGAIPGFLAEYYALPDTGFAIIGLLNSDRAGLMTEVLASALKDFGGLPPATSIPAELLPDKTRFASYAGTYEDPHTFGTITVALVGDTLQLTSSSADAFGIAYEKSLVPLSADTFAFQIMGQSLPVTFIEDASGKYVWLRTRVAVGHRSD